MRACPNCNLSCYPWTILRTSCAVAPGSVQTDLPAGATIRFVAGVASAQANESDGPAFELTAPAKFGELPRVRRQRVS